MSRLLVALMPLDDTHVIGAGTNLYASPVLSTVFSTADDAASWTDESAQSTRQLTRIVGGAGVVFALDQERNVLRRFGPHWVSGWQTVAADHKVWWTSMDSAPSSAGPPTPPATRRRRPSPRS